MKAASRESDAFRRYMSVFAGACTYFCAGSIHAVSSWDAQLKSTLAYSHADISVVLSLLSLGTYLSILPGYLFDRIGPYKSCLSAAVVLGSLFPILSYGIANAPNQMPAWIVGSIFFFVGQAANFNNLAALSVNEGLFGAQHRAKVISLGFATFSIGGASFAVIYSTYFEHELVQFFQFQGILFTLVSLFAWFALYRGDQPEFISIEEEAVPLLHQQSPQCTSNAQQTTLAQDHIDTQTIIERDVTGTELLKDSQFWMLFIMVFVVVGASNFILSNIPFIVESLGGPIYQVPTMVALFSVANCTSKLVTGAVSDYFLSTFSRVYYISGASMLLIVLFTLFIMLPPSFLVIPIIIAGLVDGIMFACYPVLVRETFGAKHLGFNFGLIGLATASGFPLFFSPIASFIYESSARTVDGEEKCYGSECYVPFFLLSAVLGCISLVASLVFARRQDKRFYSQT